MKVGEKMEDLKAIIAKNILMLRSKNNMTQQTLAQKLNYSDKAVSKWERGESLPDIVVLKSIADLFGVKIEFLLVEHNKIKSSNTKNHTIITLMSILIVFFISTVVYIFLEVLSKSTINHYLVFIYAIPESMIVWLVFNSIWFNRRRNYLIISFLIWSILLLIFLQLLPYTGPIWQLFLIGIPGEIAIILWSLFKYK